ncbi:type VII secretion protein EccB [Actinokineospora bangkokensis]|uniref:Type VII secretion protein EccB n=1 Tax=Actinokineospora bangkokensis TaxID=1193682 RepID=A0A1Q9LMS6_9PSEU|nr:type VII secretion protein EccB [Actinokineospora bangkokensis]OLR93346.1 type VII secretion protein EccB [Actinokineospora bangkokensis]
MYGRREQVQAHSFLAGRLVSAVLRTDPDAAERPLRRTTVGLAGGVGVGVLVAAGVLVAGLVSGRSAGDWREPGALIVDEDTGNRYLLIDGALRPVLNYASARLLVGGDPVVATVGSADLAGVPQGAPVGILGAPDALPTGAARPPWTVCAGTAPDGPLLTLAIGAVGGLRVAGDDQALLVRSGTELHLAWRDRRFRVAEPWVPRALGLDPDAAAVVDPAWLNALPAGPDLGAPGVLRGGAGPVVAGRPTTLGQLVSVPEAVGARTFVAVPGGLAPVTATVAALLTADPAGQALPTLRITPAELAGQPVLPAPAWQAELPANPPTALRTAGAAPCVQWSGDGAVLASAPLPTGPAREAGPAGVTRDARVADRVRVAPGAGVLARTRPAPGVPGAGVYLVTETGAKYPVAGPAAADALGLPVGTAQPVPADLLALLPTGPALDKLG